MRMLPDQLAPQPAWRPVTRVAFRFIALYFFLYVVMTQMLGALLVWPAGSLPDLSKVMNPLVGWVGDRLFHVNARPTLSGSGDKVYDWVQAFCLLTIAVAGCGLWSALDRHRLRYHRTYQWFRVFIRFALGATLIGYGLIKVFPL